MSYYFAVYGYEITKEIEFGNFVLFPKHSSFKEAGALAKDKNQFNLTAVGEIKSITNPQDLFDLAGIMTFCQQQWVILSRAYTFPENTKIDQVFSKFPSVHEFKNNRPSQGAIIIQDAFDKDARRNYLDTCMSHLKDENFEKMTNFRKALFRNIEVWRMPTQFIDVTYYLDFSSLEILARTFSQDYKRCIAKVSTDFLKHHGFNVTQDNIKLRYLGMQTYADLRNALFHNGEYEKTVKDNSNQITLKLQDYTGYLSRLIPDVLLKVMDYDDRHINWNRWLDLMPFGK